VAIVHENQAKKKVIGDVGSKNTQQEIRTEMAVFEQQEKVLKAQICPSAINI
jgi:hypothetical protein